MDLRSRGEKGGRRLSDKLLLVCLCLTGIHFQSASTGEFSSFLQTPGLTGDTVDSRNNLDALSPLQPFSSDAENKRSSSFFPLRGKKSSLDSAETPAYHPLVSEQQVDDKRSQFYPLRAKKIPTELKRASYFMPMRGRKEDQDWSGEDSLEKRMSSFMPMRGRKDGEDKSEEDSLEKRMSSFMPMRGRKDGTEEDSFEKRMSSFMPMRGRKDGEDSLEKRMSSFMPMRGKKKSGPLMDAYLHLGKSGMYTTEIMKPSSSNSNKGSSTFLPIRGEDHGISTKEHPLGEENTTWREGHSTHKRSVSFVPMRGRRILSEDPDESFGAGESLEKRRSSFMPMRGRRYSFGNANDSLLFDLNDANVSKKSVTLSMLENSKSQPDSETEKESDPEKRASSFMPMRGRRTSFQDGFNYETTSKEDKRRSSFMPMRGRRGFSEDYVPNINGLSGGYYNDDQSEQSKRGSSFMAMRGRRFGEPLPLGAKPINFRPLLGFNSVFTIGGGAMNGQTDNQTENVLADFAPEDEQNAYLMPMRGRRGTNYFYNPYPYYFPSGIGSSQMNRHFNGRLFPMSSLQSTMTKNRKFDWDSVKRAFHATRGKRYSTGDLKGLENEMENPHQMPSLDLVSSDQDPQNQEKSYDTGSFRGLKNELDNPQPWTSRVTESSDQDHQSQGKGCRCKRSILRPRLSLKSQRQYIALKRPMSFFATRGKRLDDSAIDAVSKFPIE